ncbi:retrovirus-related Pol polyprotein from transposon TNT 1-94, partial [Trifolium pratense]
MNTLKVFGSLAYASTLQANRTKLEHRGRKCIFLGYKQGVKGTILYDLHSKEIFLSRHVTYHDHILPYHTSTNPQNWHYHTNISHNDAPTVPNDLHDVLPYNNPHTDNVVDPPSPVDHANPTDSDTTSSTVNPDNTVSTHIRPSRQKQKPAYLSDYVCNTSTSSSAPLSSGNLYPISAFHSYSHLSSLHASYTNSITHCTEPNTYAEACMSEHWQSAMRAELEALAKNGTWKFVDLPSHVKPIGSKWVYKVKHKSDGSIERYKARLVAKGYNQIEGLDFFDTFSPVAKMSTVRILLALASIKHWHLHQLDVNNAFLHGELKEDVYMTVPEGVNSPKPNQVCKLLKSLYGLKQASRKWYERLTSLLLQQGYTQSTADYSLFTYHKDNDFTALLIYVDDIILAEVAHSKQGISVSQRKYCLDLLKDSGLLGSKPAATPLDPS